MDGRRDFLKLVGGAALLPVLGGRAARASAADDQMLVAEVGLQVLQQVAGGSQAVCFYSSVQKRVFLVSVLFCVSRSHARYLQTLADLHKPCLGERLDWCRSKVIQFVHLLDVIALFTVANYMQWFGMQQVIRMQHRNRQYL